MKKSISIFQVAALLVVGLVIPFMGLAQEQEEGFSWRDLPIEIQGFFNTRHGIRTQDDSLQSKDYILGETRIRLDATYWMDYAELNVKSDFVYDLWNNKLLLDMREANLFLTPISWFDIKVGRQILTWGKGDMLFINDLFPKNWESFFIGRDLEYLKAPSDAAKLTFHFPWFELNAIYVPKFNSDIFPSGRRLSLYDSFSSRHRGEDAPLMIDERVDWFEEAEYHWRIRKNIKGFDLAFYGYYGYWKSPAGLNTKTGYYTFPRLYEHGMSLEGSFVRGITSLELGHFYSADDGSGEDFAIRNSQVVLLLGHTIDFKRDLKIGVQYYAEVMLDYQALKDYFPIGFAIPNQVKDNITLRVSKLVNKQKVELSLFSYFSAIDKDFYFRPNIGYKFKDGWKLDFGANIFNGQSANTFWSQFQDNTNVYAGVKWNY